MHCTHCDAELPKEVARVVKGPGKNERCPTCDMVLWIPKQRFPRRFSCLPYVQKMRRRERVLIAPPLTM